MGFTAGRLVGLVQVGMVVFFSGLKTGMAVILKSVKGLKDEKKLGLLLAVACMGFNVRVSHLP